ncbi:MAG: aldo/keto reductase [Candidatus Latescibacteria bacterium]|nr:aldo/keto reductase [Candidatus Latescibacterota bacterium]NIM22495.1 aldo/keto reductase [Candidatus Latescibacterota bacterium]NIM64809.1 aldo/keto reductase [Candidatus Latescibacterota bacterium]NIO01317.1 aldo/keto reductase [Candidatus Latescibacterota bacterium]NIO27806.1 aldo/keto reductase [Candidatus Latescibacterota bacterium]
MDKTITSRAPLNNGSKIPYFGLGVFRAARGSETQNAIRHALDAGYRHIDTAMIYNNERDVGIAVKNSSIPRDEIFITTKVWNSDHGYDKTIRACHASLDRLGLDYVDLYLIHWPVQGLRGETWKALITLFEEGRCRSIGVSNYTIRHLEELLADTPVIPTVNQVEFSPFLYQKDLLDFCRSHQIQLEAYCSLTRGEKLHDSNIVSVAGKYNKTPAQILVRWTLEHDVVVIPKSVRKDRIYENADVFDFRISEEDMALLDSLSEDYRVTWDPTDAP